MAMATFRQVEMEDNAAFLLQMFANFADQLPVDTELKDLASLFSDHLHRSFTGPYTDSFTWLQSMHGLISYACVIL